MAKAKPFEGTPTNDERERFFKYVDTSGNDNGCWLWTGTMSPKGYGIFSYRRKNALAHRFAWFLIFGENPPLDEMDHLCNTRNCVNVNNKHVVPSTTRDNVLRSTSPIALNAKKTECINGHSFTVENTYITKSGKRQCRECSRERDSKRAKAKYEKEKQLNTHTSEMRDFAGQPKIDFQIAEEIRQLYKLPEWSQRKLARRFQVSQPMIGHIVRNESWTQGEKG